MFYFLVRLCKEHKIKSLGFCEDILFQEDGPLFDRFYFKNEPQLLSVDFETGIIKYKDYTEEESYLIRKAHYWFYRKFDGKNWSRIFHDLILTSKEDLLDCYKNDSNIKNIRLVDHSFYHTSYEDKYISVENFTVFRLPEKLANIAVNETIVKKHFINLNNN